MLPVLQGRHLVDRCSTLWTAAIQHPCLDSTDCQPINMNQIVTPRPSSSTWPYIAHSFTIIRAPGHLMPQSLAHNASCVNITGNTYGPEANFKALPEPSAVFHTKLSQKPSSKPLARNLLFDASCMSHQ
jgi:hypothetical protein